MSHEMNGPVRPRGVSHLVISVRDMDASHRFYTDVVGFELVGEIAPSENSRLHMRFYRGDSSYHHHLAISQALDAVNAPPPDQWQMVGAKPALNHVAIAYPNRDEWLRALRHIQHLGTEVLTRGDHGMTHSAYIQDPDGNGVELLYDLPPSVWEGDVNAALNYFEPGITTGAEMLVDNVDYRVFPAATAS
jgi:catechol-2,3-dioxygenase